MVDLFYLFLCDNAEETRGIVERQRPGILVFEKLLYILQRVGKKSQGHVDDILAAKLSTLTVLLRFFYRRLCVYKPVYIVDMYNLNKGNLYVDKYCTVGISVIFLLRD